MNDNNLVAERIEEMGVRTFSSAEMAFNLVALTVGPIKTLSETEPVYADLAGAMNKLKDLHIVTRDIRASIQQASTRIQVQNDSLKKDSKNAILKKRSKFEFGFKNEHHVTPNPALKELLDLSRTVVVTGFGEVGPWGNARTRWEMEAHGQFSLEGCIELAWIMGLIKYDRTKGTWIETSNGQSIADLDVKSKYEEQILKHTGIRMVEYASFEYDPAKKMISQEIVLQESMGPLEVSKAEADAFALQHGDKVVITVLDGDRYNVKFLPGCVMFIPKALKMDRFVAGQLPTGWDAARYGVPKDIIEQVDPVTLYVLVSTVEALLSSGITDPYEFYQYVHLSEVGNTSGGGVGGQFSNRGMYRTRFLDKPAASDTLQETFINTMPAWVNLLLLSSAGPIKTPVGACATAVESVEIGVDTLLSGRAKIVLVGGYDDFREESATEFANMGATSNSSVEVAKGREPSEMSRPMTASRGGFMESLGAGVQVLMTAEMAITMGCPIYGIVATTHMATDKQGRSVPAPGQGILTTARRIVNGSVRVLDITYRAEQLRQSKQRIVEWYQAELESINKYSLNIADDSQRKEFLNSTLKELEYEAERRRATELRHWGSDFATGDPRVSPLEAALARFGLTVDDIAVASFHGTGTKANDINEPEVLQKQLVHLGRTPGNMLPAICQKYLTGHPKGAAAAWMLNG